jgi:hypothetical protein
MLNFIDLIDSLFNGLERNIIRQERKNALDSPVRSQEPDVFRKIVNRVNP